MEYKASGLKTPTEDDVLGVMVDGGEKLCDHALAKWIGNEYHQTEECRAEYVHWWGEVRRAIRPRKQWRRVEG